MKKVVKGLGIFTMTLFLATASPSAVAQTTDNTTTTTATDDDRDGDDGDEGKWGLAGLLGLLGLLGLRRRDDDRDRNRTTVR